MTIRRMPRVAPLRRRQADSTGGLVPRISALSAPRLRPVRGHLSPDAGRRVNSGREYPRPDCGAVCKVIGSTVRRRMGDFTSPLKANRD